MKYSYHGRIQQRIRAGELQDHYFTEDYPGIGPALVLVFNTAPFLRPIRPHRWAEYLGKITYKEEKIPCLTSE